MRELDGRRAIVVGGASGMGAATVRAYVRAGARVVIADIDRSAGAALAGELGDRAAFLPLDVSRKDDVDACFADAVGRLGGLDILAVPAGIWGGGAASDLPASEFARIVDVIITESLDAAR